jgi:2-oxoglutarate dehydrogenase E1 component
MRILQIKHLKYRNIGLRSFTKTARLSSAETFVNSQSISYVDAMYSAWLKDPNSVHISWQTYFKNVDSGSATPFTAPPTLIPSSVIGASLEPVAAVNSIPSAEILDTMKVQLMVRAYQVRGHQLANLDPLGINFMGGQEAPELTPAYYGFTERDLDRKFYLGSGILPRFIADGQKEQRTLREIVKMLRDTYCGSIGIEYGHIPDRDQCDWLRTRFEVPTKFKYSKQRKIRILDRLMWSDHFERFVSSKYPSEKRFGLEGCESLIPGMKAMVLVFDVD